MIQYWIRRQARACFSWQHSLVSIPLGQSTNGQVRGIELSLETFQKTTKVLAARSDRPQLVHGDFFDQYAETFGHVTAVIGNPPFIRYQRFTGESRQKALRQAAQAGVRLSELSSSWAPFLVHATTFISRGGRMAVVAPAEVAHATYAQPVVRFLSSSFARVRLLVFAKRLFPELSEDTVLILAEGRGEPFESLTLHKLEGPEALVGAADRFINEVEAGQATSDWASGVTRLVEYFVPQATRELYRELAQSSQVVRLGDMADVGIGYVTGNNDYFHLSAQEAKSLGIPVRFLARALRNARDLKGLVFTKSDWRSLSDRGDKNLLLRLRQIKDAQDEGVRRYLRRGARLGVNKAYKCRTREPWYAVPHVYSGDAFLSYMSGAKTKLVANEAGAVAPNTLHVVRCRGSRMSGKRLAAAWGTALTSLSCEIEGHGLGGGMLKLEPRESARVLVPILQNSDELVHVLDAIAREGPVSAYEDETDRLMAVSLGISGRDIARLREATTILRNRRTGK